jgi:hypothetical protein
MTRLSDRYTIMSDGNFKSFFFDYFNCRDIKYQFLDISVTDHNLIDVINYQREPGKDILLILTPITILRLIREKSQWNDFLGEVRAGKIKLIMSAGHPVVEGLGETMTVLSKLLCFKDSVHDVLDEDRKGWWWPNEDELSIMADLNMDVLCETGRPGEYMRKSFPKWNFVYLSQIWLIHNEWNPVSIFSKPKREKTFFTFINHQKYFRQHRRWLADKIKDSQYIKDSITELRESPGSLVGVQQESETKAWDNIYTQYGKFWLDHITLKSWVPDLERYDSTYFELVCESLGFHPQDDSFYITEKTFKPIMMEHPFVMVSTRHHMKNLRQIGFRTFDGLIDETYDGLEHTMDRIEAIHQELKRLDIEKSRELYQESREICRHNRDHLMNLQGRCKFDLWKNLDDYFKNII